MPEGLNSGDPSGAPAAAAAEVPEVTTSEGFQQHCTNLSGICIVAALDPAADSFAEQRASLQVRGSEAAMPAVPALHAARAALIAEAGCHNL